MLGSYLILLLRFVLLLLTQLFLIEQLNLSTFINPNILILFFLTLPVDIKPLPLMFIGFTGGLVLDMFCDSPGFNSSAFLVMSYMRHLYIRRVMHADIIHSGIQPGIISVGFRWFITYAAILGYVYHLVYAFIESFGWTYIPGNIFSALISTAFSLMLVILFQMLFFRTKPKV